MLLEAWFAVDMTCSILGTKNYTQGESSFAFTYLISKYLLRLTWDRECC